ncbi:type III effector HrpK domain-containing protein [Rhizosaccharibacter radicis]|uniref:Type III effector HrpK n=1 Tax=Rhizosaccharibacter radicis TaxID=2782605 RepID=A0ABT1VTF9_9PROT|nr:hypothetical protein [Acetobacteraceae bacterium KSS12]
MDSVRTNTPFNSFTTPDGSFPPGMAGEETGFSSALTGFPTASFGSVALDQGSGSGAPPGTDGSGTLSVGGGMDATMTVGAPGGSAPGGTGDATGSAGDPPDPAIDDSSFQSSPDDLKKLAPLVAGLPPAQQEAAEKAMNRPIVAAKMLKDGSPAEKKEAQAYFDKNPALKKALDTAAHGGKADGDISSHDLSAFIGNMEKQQGRAANTVTQYQKDHPNADGQSLQLVRQSALLQAYMPVIKNNSPDKDGNVGDYMTKDGLKAVLSDAGLPSALQGAASTFSQPGMFNMLDQGGLQGHDLATHNPDGKVSEDNIIDWVSKQAPTTGGQFASTIGDAATRDAVANVDTSKLNEDVFKNPQNYTGAQKAAVLVQLQDKQQQLQAGSDLKHSDDTDKALSKDISLLSSDQDVQQYLSQAVPAGEKQIVGSDPSLSRAVAKTYQDDVLTGKMLQTGLSAVSKNNSDDKNTKQTAGSAVSDFESQTQLDADLSDGQTATAQQIVGSNVNLTSQLQGDYQRDFSQGGELKQLQGEKDADLGTSLQTTQGDEQSFESVLDPNFVQSQSSAYASTMSNAAMQDGGSGKAVISALKGDGKADTSEMAQTISQIDPSQLYGGSNTGLTASDTQALVTSFLNDLDKGSSVQDACAKFDPDNSKFDGGACDSKVMAKLQSNPAAAQGVQMMLQSMAAGALGVQGPQPAQTGPAGGGDPSAATAYAAGGDPSADPTQAGGYGTEALAAGGGGLTNAAYTVPVAGGAAGASESLATGSAEQAASAMSGATSGTPDSAVLTQSPQLSAAEQAKENAMYAGMGIGAAGILALPAGYISGKQWDKKIAAAGDDTAAKDAAQLGKDTAASRISMAGEVAGGVGGVIGAATMLPDVSTMLKNGQTTQAGLAIGMSTRGLIQGSALTANLGDMAARRAGMASTEVATFSRSWSGKAGQWATQNAAKEIGGRWAGNIVERTTANVAGKVAESAGTKIAGEVAGRAVGMAAAEAVGAAVPVVGWIADAAMGIGMIGELIAEAVKKAHEKKEMSNTVNPTLKQYGIPEV